MSYLIIGKTREDVHISPGSPERLVRTIRHHLSVHIVLNTLLLLLLQPLIIQLDRVFPSSRDFSAAMMTCGVPRREHWRVTPHNCCQGPVGNTHHNIGPVMSEKMLPLSPPSTPFRISTSTTESALFVTEQLSDVVSEANESVELCPLQLHPLSIATTFLLG